MKKYYSKNELNDVLLLNVHENHNDHEILGYTVYERQCCREVNIPFWLDFFYKLIWPLSFCRCFCQSIFYNYQEPIYTFKSNCAQCISEIE